MKNLFLLIFSFLFILTVRAEELSVYMLQTTDIHAAIFPEEGKTGSWVQLGTLINKLRNEYGEQKTLLIDCGDTIQGTFAGSYTKGEAAIPILKKLDYDAWIPGNHDFDFGFARFMELSAEVKDIIICGNVQPLENDAFPAWKIFEKDSVRIAVIGMTASYLRFWLGEKFGDSCRIETAKNSIKKIFSEILQQKPDMIVLAIHQAWTESPDPRNVNEVLDIIADFPEIDLVLGGHTHRRFPGHKISQSTWYVQAGHAAQCLGVVKADFDKKTKKLKKISSWLEGIKTDSPICPNLQDEFADLWQNIGSAQKQIVAEAPRKDILSKGRAGVNCQSSELICQAIASAVNADCALHGILSRKNLFAENAITELDLFELIPYENNIFTAELTKEELAEIILEQWQNKKYYTYSGIWGIKVKINPAETAAKIIFEKDDPLAKKERFILAMNSFTAAGSGRYPVLKKILQRKASNTKDSEISSRDALREYLKKNQKLQIQTKRWIKIRD